MKVSRRTAWIIMLIFCCLVWGSIFAAFVYGAQPDKGKPSQPTDKSSESIRGKVKSLDLNDKQRKFLESLIESTKKD
ncbi:hypothetical protein QE407_004748 [Pantoea dispersa]|nr:hypothetical protein [Pantoea dispersa]